MAIKNSFILVLRFVNISLGVWCLVFQSLFRSYIFCSVILLLIFVHYFAVSCCEIKIWIPWERVGS